MTPRPLTAPAIVMMPLNSTYQPLKNAITSSVGPGQPHTASPTSAPTTPTATDQPRPAPSTGTLNIMKIPRNNSSAPRNTARSETVQSMDRTMPPMTTLITPVNRTTHQPRLTFSTCARVHERTLNGFVPIMLPSPLDVTR